MKQNIVFALAICIGLSACDLFHKKANNKQGEIVVFDTFSADEPPVLSDLGETWTGDGEILFTNYKPAHDKKWELIHTDLEVSFDFKNRRMNGITIITLTTCCDLLDTLELDAKNMDFHNLWILPDGMGPETWALPYSHFNYLDSAILKIILPKKIHPGELLKIRIEYTAKPYEISKTGGNAAITDDRGLFFINHDLLDPSKPRQLWTQGETESNSHWFPTIDAPNQKMTQKIAMTVPDTMVTLSNGNLVKSTKNANGTRTDIWEQKSPHAPYLTMMAAGNWSVIKDKWRNKEVNYLVEKKYASYAKLNFGNTPEMMEFFSQYTGTDFPWDKYSQVVVRDFVSGAMENTSATVHMEGLQQTPDEWRDHPMEDYVSHELTHQWFGDLVTTESWSNITLNESFATYGEYLWRKYKYGQKSADFILDDFRQNYNWIGLDEEKKLVRFDYDKQGEMFDAVSYQKGALILHMLQYTIGEEFFKKGIKIYLEKNRFATAESDDLREAMEEATGKDLHWFFDQWYFGKGHPRLLLTLETDSTGRNYILHIQQTQTYRNCFNFPVKISWFENDQIISKNIFVSKRNQYVNLTRGTAPKWYIFDVDNTLLCDIDYGLTGISDVKQQISMLYQAYHTNLPEGTKYKLFNQAAGLADFTQEESVRESFAPFLRDGLRNTYVHTLNRALQYENTNLQTDPWSDGVTPDTIYSILRNKNVPTECRAQAIYTLFYMKVPEDSLLVFTSDSSNAVCAKAILALENNGKWISYGEERMVNEKRGYVAQIWARKLLSTGMVNKIETIEKFFNNPNTDITDQSAVIRTALIEANNEEDLTIARYFFQKFNTDNSLLRLKILAVNVQNEMTSLKKEIKNKEEDGETIDKTLLEKVRLYEEILSESKK